MAIFYGYVSLPEGKWQIRVAMGDFQWPWLPEGVASVEQTAPIMWNGFVWKCGSPKFHQYIYIYV